MRDWNVPPEILRTINDDLIPAMKDKDIHTQRAALNKLFDFYDAWESQVSEYGDWVAVQAERLLGVLMFAIAAAVAAIALGWGLAGFVAGGFVGTLVSVLSRLPPMLGWGNWVATGPRIFGRVGLGLAGTLAGGGLLATGMITIGNTTPQWFSQILSTSYRAATGETLYLVALGIVLGFTERMLASLAGLIVAKSAGTPRTTTTPPTTTPPPGPGKP